MEDTRELTGKWYLKKRPEIKRWLIPPVGGGYDVMVETVRRYWDDPSHGNGGGDWSPETTQYEVATELDIIRLKLNNLDVN